MAGIGFKMNAAFFDTPKVMNKTTAAERRFLSRFGAFVRRRARGSIRKRKKASEPGKPPSAHGKKLKLILFSYDPTKKSVVAGPKKFSNTNAPAGLEHGEKSTTQINGRRRSIRVKPRPFMAPAFAHEKPKIPDLLKNSIR